MKRLRAAILGSGHIGTDLVIKSLRDARHFDLALVSGIDAGSAGLARARELGVATSTAGIAAVLDLGVDLVFDATSAAAHREHAPLLEAAGILAIDLTPAAVGPGVVPVVNLPALGDVPNVNLLTCAAQASVPIIHAMNGAAKLAYAEVVSTISSRSAGPGTRHNIDEFVRTTSRGVSAIGGAQRGKAMLVINPAVPPVTMGNTIYGVPADPEIDRDGVAAAIEGMVARVAAYVPGYRLKAAPVFDRRDTPWGPRVAISVLVQVEGRGDHLPRYSGNLDIMTAAAIQVADQLALRRASAGGAKGGLS